MNRFALLLMITCVVQTVLGNGNVALNSEKLAQQRQYYVDARNALAAKDLDRYQSLREKLADYPLLPYLEYQEVHQQLQQLPYNKVDAFLEKHKGSYLAKLMLHQWLKLLAVNKRWHEYRSYYLPILDSARHECWYLWSRFKTGDRKALEETERLWNVPKSQPHDCDPLFQQWQDAGYLSVELVWDRHQKALLQDQKRLARYLRDRMPNNIRQLALTFHHTLNNPSLLYKKSDYKLNHNYMRDIVYYGLKRYVHSEPVKAKQLWQGYQQYHNFTAKQTQSFYFRLAKEFAYLGDQVSIQHQLDILVPNERAQVIETLIRSLLHQQNWQAVLNWINRLPTKELKTDRWRYWQARARQTLFLPNENYQDIFEQLAETRGFYGFLSADLLNKNYNLQHSPSNIEQQTLKTLLEIPGILRAREQFFFDELHHARQEWANTTIAFSVEEYQAVARLAYDWGWYRKSIESMAAAKAWDDLHIRFPVAHEDIVRRQAQQTNLPPNLIFAIARQESAWETDAQSSAGAMGLMQLLPRTAKSTATKVGLIHNKKDLFKPEHNITLGSLYISELLNQYENNRVPAIAAYNAGPHRVDHWLERSDNRLPHDVWIEAIPFNETRKYVQNVLSYAVVYAYRIGEHKPLLTQQEVNKLL